MMWISLPIILICWYPVVADYACVCSNHIAAKIYRTADSHTEPIGMLYPDAGECKPAYNDSSHPNFVALVHFHEIGYVLDDKDITITNCAGHPDRDDLVTTPPPHITPLTQPPSHTTLSGGCNKIALFMDIALDKNVGTPASRHCPDNVHYGADAAVKAFCGAPDTGRWLKGRKVVDFAGAIPKYSPVGLFTAQNSYSGQAGVYLGYINSTLFVASQNCHSNLEIQEIKASVSPHLLNEFYEIKW